MSGAMLEVPVKFTLVRNGEVVETRRARLVDPSFEAVVTAGAQWAKGVPSVQYKDDEGDLVTMDTEEEWGECVRLWTEAGMGGALALRLVLPSVGNGSGRWWRGPRGERAGRCGSRSRSRSRSMSGDRRRRRCRKSDNEDQEGEAGPQQVVVVEKVLRRLHGDDTMAALGEGRVGAETLGCGDWLTVSVLGDGEVDLNVNVSKLYRVLERRGLQALAGGGDEAVAWFELCTELCPKAAHGWYNLGCAHLVVRLPMAKTDGARDDVTGAALDALEEAVRCGYRAWRHMATDEDLMSVRAHPRFLALLPERHGHRQWWGGMRVLGRFLAQHPHGHARRGGFEAGGKCNGCGYATTGVAPDHCCWMCLKRPGCHGPHCKREEASRAAEGEVTAAEAPPLKAERGEGRACARAAKAEMRASNNHVNELAGTACQRAGCTYEASGRSCASGYCCKKCARGAGHGKACTQKVFEPEPTAPIVHEPEPEPVSCEPVATSEPLEVVPPEAEYGAQIASLRGMGFPVDDAMLRALRVHGGDLMQLVNSLL